MFEEITTLENNIRNYINIPRYQYDLMQDIKKWNQLCSSLDIIGDTTLAIKSYYNCVWPSDSGMQYLLIYGLLQSIFIQQDALKHIAETLDIKLELTKELKDIRELRNDAIGHPTKRNSGERQTSHFISRISIQKDRFTLISLSKNNSNSKEIDIISTIEKQINSVKFLLLKVVKILNDKEKKHKEKYRNVKLVDIFPAAIDYYFSKILECISLKYANKTIGYKNIKFIYDSYTNLINELKSRGEYPANEVLVNELNEINYPINKLIEYFSDSKNSKLNDEDASIFAYFIKYKHKEIVQLLKEVDKEYSLPYFNQNQLL